MSIIPRRIRIVGIKTTLKQYSRGFGRNPKQVCNPAFVDREEDIPYTLVIG
jgi:hypothetical protein